MVYPIIVSTKHTGTYKLALGEIGEGWFVHACINAYMYKALGSDLMKLSDPVGPNI